MYDEHNLFEFKIYSAALNAYLFIHFTYISEVDLHCIISCGSKVSHWVILCRKCIDVTSTYHNTFVYQFMLL